MVGPFASFFLKAPSKLTTYSLWVPMGSPTPVSLVVRPRGGSGRLLGLTLGLWLRGPGSGWSRSPGDGWRSSLDLGDGGTGAPWVL